MPNTGLDYSSCLPACSTSTYSVSPMYYSWPTTKRSAKKRITILQSALLQSLRDKNLTSLDIKAVGDDVTQLLNSMGVLDLYPIHLQERVTQEEFAYQLRSLLAQAIDEKL